jgi:hypothetical protein
VKIGGKEIKNEYVLIGGGILFGFVFYYVERRHASTAAASAAATTQANAAGAVAGDTESGYGYDYGGVDPETGLPFVAEANSGNATASQYQTNEQWLEYAEEYAVQDLGATQALAQQALGDYLLNKPGGLPANEYTLVSEVLALIGPPPVGSFNLFEAPSTSGTGTGSTSIGGVPRATPIPRFPTDFKTYNAPLVPIGTTPAPPLVGIGY